MKTFVKRSIALKGGKTKADYVREAKEKGFNAVYSGRKVIDAEGEVTRDKGFYLIPIPKKTEVIFLENRGVTMSRRLSRA